MARLLPFRYPPDAVEITVHVTGMDFAEVNDP